MVKKAIKNSMVTREQYDKLQVDVVNRIEELELEIEKLQEKQNNLAQANNNRFSDIRVLAILWAITTIGLLAEILII
ncbi:uncharacterized protein METZ01_LOCUS280474 [marine metagenome]|uniref:Uncharacterized protein n=1 Tax=marine metagenome TaxID=408172 RepID=A0A382KT22_9ZZZZ